MRSIRSFSRARTSSQRGFALIWAVGLAIIFFMLIQLMLIDSARELAEARRFRAKIVAQTLAENGAELAAAQIVDRSMSGPVSTQDWQGKATGDMKRNEMNGEFLILGEGEAGGTDTAKARVEVAGVAMGGNVDVNYTVHTP